MSEAEREDAKEVAVQAVKEHLEISEKTRVRTSIKNAVGIGATVVAGTVAVCTYLNKMSNSEDRIEATLNNKVSFSEFTSWTQALDRANRTTVPTLVVPAVVQPEEKK
jgi:hypothetical protein